VVVLVEKFVTIRPPVRKTPVWFGSIKPQVSEMVWLVPRRVVEVAVTVTVGAAGKASGHKNRISSSASLRIFAFPSSYRT
jgi:hypothetical protein